MAETKEASGAGVIDGKLSVLIAVVSNQRRGAELEGVEVGGALTDLGVEVSVVALKDSDDTEKLSIPALGRRALSLRTLSALRRRARRHDVVIAYGSTTLPACAIALLFSRKRFVYRSIGDPAYWLRSELHRARTGILYRRADMVVVLWPDAAESVKRLFRVRPERTAVVPNCRSSKRFLPVTDERRRNARESLGIAASEFVVLSVGSLTHEKRLERAIAAVSKCDGFLLVVGEGELRPQLEMAAGTMLPGKSLFTGQWAEVSAAYHAADVLLLTSQTEGMPGVILEAALCGLGFVAPDVGAVRWLADVTGSGLAFDVHADAESIARLLIDSRSRPSPPRLDSRSVLETDEVAKSWLQILRRVAHSMEAELRA